MAKKIVKAKTASKMMRCTSCGWEWKVSDGGSDVTTCHKCGGKAKRK